MHNGETMSLDPSFFEDFSLDEDWDSLHNIIHQQPPVKVQPVQKPSSRSHKKSKRPRYDPY